MDASAINGRKGTTWIHRIHVHGNPPVQPDGSPPPGPGEFGRLEQGFLVVLDNGFALVIRWDQSDEEFVSRTNEIPLSHFECVLRRPPPRRRPVRS